MEWKRRLKMLDADDEVRVIDEQISPLI